MAAYFHKPFFRKTFLSYAIFLIVCMMAFSIAMYRQIVEQDYRMRQQESLSKMRLIAQVLDDKFMEMDRIGIQLNSSGWLPKVRSQSDIIYADIDWFKQREICQEMGAYHSIVRVAKSTALLLPQKEIAIDRVSFWEEDRYLASLRLADAGQVTAALQVLPQSFNAFALFPANGSDGDFLLLKQLNYSNPAELVLFFYVDGKQFGEIMLQGLGSELEALEIVAQEQSVFRYRRGEPGREELYASTIPSSLYNWSYSFEMELGRPAVLGRIGYWSVAVLLSFFLGLTLAYLLAWVSYKPMVNLLRQLNTRIQEEGNEFELIQRNFQALRKEKVDLEHLASQYYNTARNNLFQMLLRGTFEPEDVEENLRQFGVGFHDQMEYLVVLIDYSDIMESGQRALDYFALVEFGEENGIASSVTETAEQNLTVILYGPAGEELIEDANRYREHCRKILGTDVTVACGLPHGGLAGISRSYQVAWEQINRANDPQPKLYYYPIDWEIQLINYLRIGNESAVEGILRELREENENRELPKEDQRHVATIIMETFLRVGMELNQDLPGIREEFGKIVDSGSADWIWDYFAGYAHVLCHRTGAFEEESSSGLGADLVSYVDEHFTEYSLSQQVLADHFNISQSAVSKLFKKTAKVNFIDYLHLLRIQRAKKLFDAGELDVLAVAQQTGYENEITFRRAFLRFESLTPRKYMQQQKSGVQ